VEHWLFSCGHQPEPLVHLPFGAGGTPAAGVGQLGTLLGPEDTGACAVGLLGERRLVPRHTASVILSWVGWGWWRSGCWDCLYFENCIVDASIICSCQVIKGTRWMPWHQEPMKDVGACDKPRGVGNQTLIRGFPNGETCQP
jgi:hypothetical protein